MNFEKVSKPLRFLTMSVFTLLAMTACSGGGGGSSNSGGDDGNNQPPPIVEPPAGPRTSPPQLSVISNYDTFGQSRDVLVEDQYIYAADGATGLLILNLPKFGQPYPAGKLSLNGEGRAYSIQKNGNFVYLTTRSEGIYVINVTDPTLPVLVTVLATPGDASYSALTGNRYYVTTSSHFIIYDVSDATSPVELSSYESSSPLQHLQVVANTAYIAAYNEGLLILDLADERTPGLTSTTDLDFNATAIDVTGNEVILGGDSSLAIVNTSDKSAPSITTNHSLADIGIPEFSIVSFSRENDFLYLAASTGGVAIIDVSHSSELIVVETIVTPPTSALELFIIDRSLIVADGPNGVLVLDIFATTDSDGDEIQDGSDIFPTDPNEWEDADGDGIGDNSDLDDDNDGVPDNNDDFPNNPLESSDSDGDNVGDNSDLYPNDPLEWEDGDTDGIADNSDLNQAVQISSVTTIDTLGQARGVIKDGDTVFVADGTAGVQIYQIQADGTLVKVGEFELGLDLGEDVSARSLQKIGNILYVAYRSQGLYVLDVTNLSDPQVITTRETLDRSTFVTVFGDRLYLSDRDWLQIFDISNPENPIFLGSAEAPEEYHRLVAENNILYIAGYYAGLVILDMEDPANVTPISRTGADGFPLWAIAKKNNYVFVGGEGSGLRVYDVEDPSIPELVATLPLPSEAIAKPADQPPFKMELSGNYLFVADGFSGLQIVNISDPLAPVIETELALSGYVFDFTISGYTMIVGATREGIYLLNLGESLDHDGDGIPNFLDNDPLNAN